MLEPILPQEAQQEKQVLEQERQGLEGYVQKLLYYLHAVDCEASSAELDHYLKKNDELVNKVEKKCEPLGKKLRAWNQKAAKKAQEEEHEELPEY